LLEKHQAHYVGFAHGRLDIQTKGHSLEAIDLLFSGPKILMHLPADELARLQEQEIASALADDRIELGGVKGKSEVMHVESV